MPRNPGLSITVMMLFVFCVALEVFSASDHFPSSLGNYWIYSYSSSSTFQFSYTHDSGTVRWEILSLSTTGSNPSQVTARIKETRSCVYRYVSDHGVGQGGTFSSPLVSYDSLSLCWSEPGNAIKIQGSDTCPVMAHDPATIVGVDVRDTAVTIAGAPVSAVVIDPLPCQSRTFSCNPSRFITAEGIGPVGLTGYWKDAWIGCVIGGETRYESWILVETNLLPTGILLPRGNGHVLLEKKAGIRDITRACIFDLSGREMILSGSGLPVKNQLRGSFVIRYPDGMVEKVIR